MELLLWRWSTTAQITSALMIAVFFVVLARSMRRVEMRLEMRPWVGAWLWNLAPLLVTIIFWYFQPSSKIAFVVLRGGYFLSKTMFVVLLTAGAFRFVRQRPSLALRRAAIACVVLYAHRRPSRAAEVRARGWSSDPILGRPRLSSRRWRSGDGVACGG
jgi:hypothetical protein